MKNKKLLLGLSVSAMALGFSGQGIAAVAGCEPATTQAQQDELLESAWDFRNPPVYDFTGGEAIIADMTVRFMETTLAGCPTRLRNYGGDKYDGRPVGPTMLIKPGQQYLGLIDNQLPPPANGKRLQSHGGESTSSGYVAPDGAHAMVHNVAIADATKEENEINKYKFNITNLHTHGWHVSPTENHDNIFAEIHPGDKPYLQQVVLPDNHVAGSFWYHAHVHGSTTIQVASGMAGALIVEDETKGLDAIPQIRDAKDNVFVFQQLAYDENGEINDYTNLQQVPYSNLNRPVFVNGQAYPKIFISRKEVQRWRFIHAGITDGIQPMLVTDYQDSANTAYTPLWEIALDGLPTGEILPISYADLAPGYRVDVLVQLDSEAPDVLYLIDQGQGVNKSSGAPNLRRILAQIIVEDNPSMDDDLPSEPQVMAAKNDYIYGQYKPNMPDPFRGMGPLNDITDEQLTGKNQFVHFLASSQYVCPPQGGSCKPCLKDGSLTNCDPNKRYYMVCDGKEPVIYTDSDGVTHTNDIWSCFNFNPSTDYARTLALDTASMWQVSGQLGGAGTTTTPYHNTNHTFHIHVNPFLVQRKFVNSAYVSGDADTWVWKDTLRAPTVAFPTTIADGSAAVANGTALGPAILKSRYTDFTGAFVQHCHVLNHEDQGMMQVVEVVPALNDLDDNPADSEQAGNHTH